MKQEPDAANHPRSPQSAERPASELTVRAVVSGLFVGSLIGASNICIGLKIGWTFGASITAAVISFALFRGLAGVLRTPYGAKENLITATAGSAAGTMASAGGFVACIPALELYYKNNPGTGTSFPTFSSSSGRSRSRSWASSSPSRSASRWWCGRSCAIPPARPRSKRSRPCTLPARKR